MLKRHFKDFSKNTKKFSAEIIRYEKFKSQYPKYKNLEDLKNIVFNEKKNNKKVSFISGNFNVIHPGHLRLLKFAKEISDILVIFINPDNHSNTKILRKDRMESMHALSLVDYVVNEEIKIEKLISYLKPDCVVKGKEFEKKINIEEKIVKSYGGKLYFSSGEFSYSSYYGLDNSKEPKTNIYAQGYLNRHKIKIDGLNSVINNINKINSLVVGDLIIDQYILCDALGMSQEDPTIVLSPNEKKEFVGGAGIVAKHIDSLGASTSFCTVVGMDDGAKSIKNYLEKTNIKFNLISDETRPTTIKQRFQSKGKTLLRVNELRQHSISKNVIKKFEKYVIESIKNKNLLVFSDFNYGCLPQILVDKITKLCKKNKIDMVADSQSSSQVGDISRFKNALLITPTEHEARLALKDYDNGIPVIAEKLHKKTNAKNVAITLGPDGLFLSNYDKGFFKSDKLPAFSNEALDPSGAGDCFLAVTSLCLSSGSSFWKSAYVGSICAGIQVSKLGNQAISKKEILEKINIK